jgi:hypothetical protein
MDINADTKRSLVKGLDGRKEDVSPFTCNDTTFVHKVQRLIEYLDLGKCWSGPGKGAVKLIFYILVSGL